MDTEYQPSQIQSARSLQNAAKRGAPEEQWQARADNVAALRRGEGEEAFVARKRRIDVKSGDQVAEELLAARRQRPREATLFEAP